MSGVFFGAASSAAGSFLKADTATEGTWRGLYGDAGAMMAGVSSSAPTYAQVTMFGQSSWTWAPSTTDTRALQNGVGTDRIAAAWYAANSFTVDINVTDGNTHALAGYFLDWNFGSRSEKVELLNAATGAVIDSRTLTAFTSGEYIVWNVSGHVQIRITKTGGSNAVLSGLFFGQ